MATAGLPVLVLTGSGSEELEAELMDEGADDYIRKPLDPARFVARIKTVLRRAGG
jgi:two-component system response regulator TctD